MTEKPVNLVIDKKASFEYVFYMLDVYDKTKLPNDPAQTPKDLTGCSGVALIKDKVGGTTLGTFTVSFPLPTIGQAKIALTAAQTTSLNFTKGVWDVYVTFPGGKVDRPLYGDVTLRQNVS